LLELAQGQGFIARKPRDGKPYFVAALLRMTGEERKRKEEGKKKQVPHPSALRAYGLRMTRNSTAKGKGRRPTLNTEGSGTRKGYGAIRHSWAGVAIGAKTDTCKPEGPCTRKGWSNIRASRVWAQDDTKSDCERQRQKTDP